MWLACAFSYHIKAILHLRQFFCQKKAAPSHMILDVQNLQRRLVITFSHVLDLHFMLSFSVTIFYDISPRISLFLQKMDHHRVVAGLVQKGQQLC